MALIVANWVCLFVDKEHGLGELARCTYMPWGRGTSVTSAGPPYVYKQGPGPCFLTVALSLRVLNGA